VSKKIDSTGAAVLMLIFGPPVLGFILGGLSGLKYGVAGILAFFILCAFLHIAFSDSND
jgi:hypothetical protein